MNNDAEVAKVMRDFDPDIVAHLAAESHVDRSIESSSVFISTNVLGTQQLLESAIQAEVATFIHVSTDEVYGEIPSGSAHEGSPIMPTNPYSASKAAAEMIQQIVRKIDVFGLHLLTLDIRQHADRKRTCLGEGVVARGPGAQRPQNQRWIERE